MIQCGEELSTDEDISRFYGRAVEWMDLRLFNEPLKPLSTVFSVK
jgi:hypothetical protein